MLIIRPSPSSVRSVGPAIVNTTAVNPARSVTGVPFSSRQQQAIPINPSVGNGSPAIVNRSLRTANAPISGRYGWNSYGFGSGFNAGYPYDRNNYWRRFGYPLSYLSVWPLYGPWYPPIYPYLDDVPSGYALDPAVPYAPIPTESATPIPSSNVVPIPATPTESGLRITQVVDDGPAKAAELRPGDIIIAVGDVRVRTFEELQSALAQAKGETNIIFINGESGKTERLPVTPADGKLGVAVIPVDLK
jgi:hypothetical protein